MAVPTSGFRAEACSNVAKLLRKEREHQRLSMTRLAELAGLSQGMISLVEHELRNPSLDTLMRICEALNIDLSSVIRRAERAARRTKPSYPARPGESS